MGKLGKPMASLQAFLRRKFPRASLMVLGIAIDIESTPKTNFTLRRCSKELAFGTFGAPDIE